MDFDRLNIHEAAKVSKVIEALGTPATAEDLASCVSICEAAASLYRKELLQVSESNQRHA